MADNSRTTNDTAVGTTDTAIGRRKHLYVAPAIASQSMSYALAGCGKAQPQQLNCFRVPRSGS